MQSKSVWTKDIQVCFMDIFEKLIIGKTAMAVPNGASRGASPPTYKSSEGTREELCQKLTQSTKKDRGG